MKLPVVPVPTIEIAKSRERFPVRRIFCVGQNYAAHAREMGSNSDRKPPFFFSKPADAVVASGTELEFARRTADFHYEVELVLALGEGGRDIKTNDALSLIYGWAVGIDLTRRDLQCQAKAAGAPWDMAKGFDCSAPVGPLVRGLPPSSALMTLSVNNEKRQSGDIADMIWPPAEIITELSTYVSLAPGDLIFTGTPAGVGPIRPGDHIRGSLTGAMPLEIYFKPH